MMVTFIDAKRDEDGVESICAHLPIAPSTYYAQKAQAHDPTQRSARAQHDATLRVKIRRVWAANFRIYGARKVWRQLGREAIVTARCTVERLMRAMGLQGATRGRAFTTTMVRDVAGLRPADLVQRDVHSDAAESTLGRRSDVRGAASSSLCSRAGSLAGA